MGVRGGWVLRDNGSVAAAMKYVSAAENHTFSITLDPPADANTVLWTLRDNGGVALLTNQTITNPSEATLVQVPTLAASNTKTLGQESRFLVVNWQSAGQRYTLTYPYVLIDFLPLRAQPVDVRTVLALNEAELDDAEVDLTQAALVVAADIGQTPFMTALTAGDITTDYVNLLVVYRAAIALGPSLPARISSSMSVEGNKFSRLGALSPEKVLDALRQEYDRIRTVLTDPTYVPPLIFGTSKGARQEFIHLIPWPLAPFVGQTGVWQI